MKRLTISVLVMFFGLFVKDVRADDWGCQVLLCLSNPRGPTAVAECVPPIERLWASLRKFRPDPFPKCILSNGSSSSGNIAQPTQNHYPLCPQGLTPLPAGVYVNFNGTYVKGFGDGNNLQPNMSREDQQSLPQMACVGQIIGSSIQMMAGDNGNGDNWGDGTEITVNQYSDVQIINPSDNGRVVDVYISGQLVNRVQY